MQILLRFPNQPIDTNAAQARRQRAHGGTAKSALQARGGASEWAVVNEEGERILVPRHWPEVAVKTAKRPNFTRHRLRHTFASRLVMIGVDLRTVQDLMGHNDIRMPCRYAHLAPGHKLGAAEKLAAWDRANPTGTRTYTGRKPQGDPKLRKPT